MSATGGKTVCECVCVCVCTRIILREYVRELNRIELCVRVELSTNEKSYIS